MSTDYVDLPELKKYLTIASTDDDAVLASSITAASRHVDGICGRFFYQLANTTMTYYPAGLWHATIDDIATAAGLTVATDSGNAGTYATAWTVATDFILEPANQRMNGIPGWPYTTIRATGNRVFPQQYAYTTRAPIRLVGTFGWPAIPAAVTAATKILAAELFKRKDAPFGVAGFDSFGAVRIREDARMMSLLAPYIRPVLVG